MKFGTFCKKHNLSKDEQKLAFTYLIALRIADIAELIEVYALTKK